jgi:hypothetical protein
MKVDGVCTWIFIVRRLGGIVAIIPVAVEVWMSS